MNKTDTPDVVSVIGDRILIESLAVDDADAAEFVMRTEESDRARLVSDGVRVGLLAMRNVGVSVNIDFIAREFDQLLARVNTANEEAENALEETLRSNFGDTEGRLPRMLEEFLGDRGKLRTFVSELFDEDRRDSAIGRFRVIMERYFDGDGAILAATLDPTRQGSPLYQFRNEMAVSFKQLGERLAAIEAASVARADERRRGTAKGGDFEDLVESLLGEIARGAGDLVERTSTIEGVILRCKKGDFVVTVDPSRTGGTALRIVVECKSGKVAPRRLADEVRVAKENREASVALVVFETGQAPSGIAPVQIVGTDVYCVADEMDDTPLELGMRIARLMALLPLRDASGAVDATVVLPAITEIRDELKSLQAVKATLTGMQRSVTDGASSIAVQLERVRQRILSLASDIEDAVSPDNDITSMTA